MSSSLICGKYVISRVLGVGDVELTADGAVFQRDGQIVEVGRKADLLIRHIPDEIIGSDRHVLIPGFVNAHHHLGMTPTQLGVPDLPLELWIPKLMGKRNVDPYLDTLYSAFELIGSGVTTVQHIQYGVQGPVENIHAVAREVLRAYRDIGMRASYSHVIVDQNRLVHEDDTTFAARLPKPLGDRLNKFIADTMIPLNDNFALFETLYKELATDDRLEVQLAPANLHWCSDNALIRTKDWSDRFGVPMHLHLLETMFQREYARRRSGRSAVEHVRDLGLLGPKLTLGHAVWLSESDIECVASSGCHICSNASSNLRLRSGIAPLNRFAKHGIPVCIGIDEAGINDDRDMIQEMRMILNIHRTPGIDDTPPTCAQVLRMATEYGAQTTPFADRIGTLEQGKAADCLLLNWERISRPYLDEELPIADAVVRRASSRAVDIVVVAGEAIWLGGRSTRLSPEDILNELSAKMREPITAAEREAKDLGRQVSAYVHEFYSQYECNTTGNGAYLYNGLSL